MPEEEIEALADRLYRAYAALPEADKRRVDPELMAEKLLGLRVVYRRLSRDGSILGITAPESVGVPVLEGGGKAWFFLDGNTILLDAGLLSPWASKGRRRFTLMHEIGHRLLQGAASADRGAGGPPGLRAADAPKAGGTEPAGLRLAARTHSGPAAGP